MLGCTSPQVFGSGLHVEDDDLLTSNEEVAYEGSDQGVGGAHAALSSRSDDAHDEEGHAVQRLHAKPVDDVVDAEGKTEDTAVGLCFDARLLLDEGRIFRHGNYCFGLV